MSNVQKGVLFCAAFYVFAESSMSKDDYTIGWFCSMALALYCIVCVAVYLVRVVMGGGSVTER